MRAAELREDEGKWVQTVPVKEWYSIQDVCTIMDVGGPSVYGALDRGTLKGFIVNGVKMVKHEDLVAYIATRAAVPVYDESRLEVVPIVPSKKAEKSAATMAAAVTEGAATEEDLSFLDEA